MPVSCSMALFSGCPKADVSPGFRFAGGEKKVGFSLPNMEPTSEAPAGETRKVKVLAKGSAGASWPSLLPQILPAQTYCGGGGKAGSKFPSLLISPLGGAGMLLTAQVVACVFFALLFLSGVRGEGVSENMLCKSDLRPKLTVTRVKFGSISCKARVNP